jgi:hypothetical protein
MLACLIWGIVRCLINEEYEEGFFFSLGFFPQLLFYSYTVCVLMTGNFGPFLIEVVALIYCGIVVILSIMGIIVSLIGILTNCFSNKPDPHGYGVFVCLVFVVGPLCICLPVLMHGGAFLYCSYETH